jgi:hypothetical protein
MKNILCSRCGKPQKVKDKTIIVICEPCIDEWNKELEELWIKMMFGIEPVVSNIRDTENKRGGDRSE